MKHVFLFSFLTFLLFIRNSVSLDSIMPPFERFEYDLDMFIPVVTQEVEFAELSGLTDDQAYEQLKTFFPSLQQRVQEMVNMGVYADDKRRKNKEFADVMCGQGHRFGGLIVQHKIRRILEAITSKRVNVANNLKMLTAVRDALIQWKRQSRLPCLKKGR